MELVKREKVEFIKKKRNTGRRVGPVFRVWCVFFVLRQLTSASR